jgi:predicted ATPase/class 3 adenylate cyclase
LPPSSGIVTVMFTDLEASTALVSRLGDEAGYGLLREHEHVLREAFAAHAVRDVRGTGDGFVATFTSARAALACAVAIQRALERRNAAAPEPLRVRIGLHAGEVVADGGDLRGVALHVAARVMGLADGGEILATDAVRQIAAAGPEVAFSDRGTVSLRGVPERWRLHRVEWRDGAGAPPTRPAEVVGLGPPPPTPTIGREADIARVRALLLEAGTRLVTVVGPGGVGKTRLAVEVARALDHETADVAGFVELASVEDHRDVASTIARALAVEPRRGETPETALLRRLAYGESVLVLDNLEHLLDAVPLLASLLGACHGLTVLATSREPLALRAERVYRLEPLPLPPADAPADALLGVPAVALVVGIAQARAGPLPLSAGDAPHIAEICRRLDGLPLALELAAGRLGLLSPRELAERLARDARAVGTGPRDAPARQRTLRATLEWSHTLLTEEERTAFAAIAVFAGGASPAAAEEVTDAPLDVLDSLVAKQMVRSEAAPDGGRRLSMLETVRTFAREHLDARPDAAAIRDRHLRHFVPFAEEWRIAYLRDGSNETLARLDLELDNVRAALAWAAETGDAERALRLALALSPYTWVRRTREERTRWLAAGLALGERGVPPAILARALAEHAAELDHVGDHALAGATHARARVAAAAARDPAAMAEVELARAHAVLQLNRPDDARPHAERALDHAREARDPVLVANALMEVALCASTLADALGAADEAARTFRAHGNTRALAQLMGSLAYTAIYLGEDRVALRLVKEALEASDTLNEVAYASSNGGIAEALLGNAAAAASRFRRALEAARDAGVVEVFGEAVDGLAAVAALEGRDVRAARLHGAASAAGGDPHDPVIAERLERTIFAAARARLGDAAWEAAVAEGRALTRDEAFAVACADG